MGIYKRHNYLCDYCARATELIRFAVDSAEADLMAVGHQPDSDDRKMAMAKLRVFIARSGQLLDSAPANWELR